MSELESAFQIILNGQAHTVAAAPQARLLDVVRSRGLTGSKEGCGEGECGACTVSLDGEPVLSCLVAVGQCAGRTVETIEHVARGPEGAELLSAVQAALLRYGAAQCGICTPGIVMMASHLLASGGLQGLHGEALRAAVREGMAGNICRCTGYQAIVDAIAETAQAQAAGRPA